MPLRYNLPTLPHSDGPPRSEEARLMTAPASARVMLDDERVIGPISPLLFGGFAEHMGRCIYRGIYGPGSPLADERGCRRDVLEALGELRFRTIRYAGGNFLSGYHRRDGIGPAAARSRRSAAGLALDALVQAPTYQTSCFGDVALFDVSACHDPESGRGAVFLVHRSLDAALPTERRWRGATPERLVSVEQVSGRDPKAANTFAAPDTIGVRALAAPPLAGGRAALELPPLSFTVVRYE
jgi:alpha-L-arabinofuranosidase